MPPRSRARRRDARAAAEFVERFASAMVHSGMPRMPARVFAVLLSEEDGASTAAHLSDVLQASPAAISGAVRYLLQTRLITKDKRPGERHDTYRLYGGGWYEVLYNREPETKQWAALAREGVEAVGPATEAGRRLTDTAEFFEFLAEEMSGMLVRWRERQAGG
jgi:DNA-binding transcriptional regulator GbsR (MarR family)